jgi:hypothetical protein
MHGAGHGVAASDQSNCEPVGATDTIVGVTDRPEALP